MLPDLAPGTYYDSPVEEVIVGVYRDLLHQPSFSQHDDFFDNGGDSLLASSAVIRLEELLGHVVLVSQLFHGRTPSMLAPLLERDNRSAAQLSTLQASGAGMPLFCLPDIFGRSLSLVSLARTFEGERPVYGLSPGILEDETIRAPSLARLTQMYVETIYHLNPPRPLFVMGYSAGGIPAIDLACSLQDNGDDVVLVLIDPVSQRISRGPRDSLRRRKRALRALWASGREAAEHAFTRRPVPGWVPSAYSGIAAALLQAEAEWKPRAFRGRVIFIEGRVPDPLHPVVLTAWKGFSSVPKRWRPWLKGPVEVASFDVGHYDLVREPFVHKLAGFLRSRLD